MKLKQWRIQMQKNLLEIELIENNKDADFRSISSAIINNIQNLVRDIEVELKGLKHCE